MISLTLPNLKRNDTNELIYETDTDSKNKFMVIRGKQIVKECGIDMYTLLYLKRITRLCWWSSGYESAF